MRKETYEFLDLSLEASGDLFRVDGISSEFNQFLLEGGKKVGNVTGMTKYVNILGSDEVDVRFFSSDMTEMKMIRASYNRSRTNMLAETYTLKECKILDRSEDIFNIDRLFVIDKGYTLYSCKSQMRVSKKHRGAWRNELLFSNLPVVIKKDTNKLYMNGALLRATTLYKAS